MNPKLIVAHAGLLRDFAALAEEMGMHDEAEELLEAADECEELDDAQAEALGLASIRAMQEELGK